MTREKMLPIFIKNFEFFIVIHNENSGNRTADFARD